MICSFLYLVSIFCVLAPFFLSKENMKNACLQNSEVGFFELQVGDVIKKDTMYNFNLGNPRHKLT